MIYQTIWNELKNRVQVSISQQITPQDLLNTMNAFEEHYKQEIMEEVMKQTEKKKKK